MVYALLLIKYRKSWCNLFFGESKSYLTDGPKIRVVPDVILDLAAVAKL